MTSAICSFKESYPSWLIDTRRTACDEIFDNNPRITPLDDNDPDVEKYIAHYEEIHNSGWNGIHFADAYRIDLEQQLNSDPNKVAKYGIAKIKSTGIKPEIFISDQEKSWHSQVWDIFQSPSPYWVLNAGFKEDYPLKNYPFWQEVADLFNERFKGRIHLVQTGEAHPEHFHAPLKGVLNLVGKTDKRQFIRLVYNSHGTIGPMSYQHHLAAALELPHVTVLGGREGPRWEMYNVGTMLDTVGMLRCCKGTGCWLSGKIEKDGKDGRCKDLVDYEGQQVPRCMSLITPEEIVNSIEKYYLGGELKMPDSAKSVDVSKAIIVEPIDDKKSPVIEHTALPIDKKLVSYLDKLQAGAKVLLNFGHGLGDVVLFYPAVQELRKRYPDIIIDLKLSEGLNRVFGDQHFEDNAYDFIFDIQYWMSEGSGLMKVEKCCKDEIGIPCSDYIKNVPDYLPKYPKPIVAVHFQNSSNPAVGCDYSIAKLIWNEIIAVGLIPIEVHYEHNRHNAVNTKFDFISSDIRDCKPDVQNLIGIIRNSYAFIGVVSGPFHIASSCAADRTLYLEKDYTLENYCRNPLIKKISIRKGEYIRGSVSDFLTELIEKQNYKILRSK